MNFFRTRSSTVLSIAAALTIAPDLPALAQAPTAEVAKRCMHYSYVVYPYKRPGAVRMSSDRGNYFKDCMAKKGEVPAPTGPAQATSQTTGPAPLPEQSKPSATAQTDR